MHERAAHRARILSSVAATAIALACGTNYVYSAWAPQFADKLKLSATQSNLIGLAGNLGMYSLGAPIGMFVDARGPRPAVVVGAVLLALGYFPLRQAFAAGRGSVPLLCLVSYLTGLGGCMAFAASVKTSALNWPHHRGTATAFPLAAFGLSAFFFSVLGSLAVPGDTGGFLLLLAVGTSGLTLAGFFFLRVLPPAAHGHHYHALPGAPEGGGAGAGSVDGAGGGGGGLSDSQQLRRTLSAEDKAAAAAEQKKKRQRQQQQRAGTRPRQLPPDDEPGRSPALERKLGDDDDDDDGANTTSGSGRASASASASGGSYAEPRDSEHGGAPRRAPAGGPSAAEDADQDPVDETSSLVSRDSSLPGEVLVQNSVDMDRSHRVDIRGWNLMRNVEFWQFFAIMGILAGIGLMTINNIGHDANALWKRYDDSVDEAFLVQRQQMHVSILSVASFAGRLLSGVGSDFLVKRLHASRVWCLVVAAVIFVAAQLCAIRIANPHLLGFVSSLSGLGYGFLFGVFPSIVAETFGIHGLSQNWGFMTLSPVLSGNVFNLFYGAVFDHHSVVGPTGERSCGEGLACYRAAYFVTLAACGVGLAVTLLVIRHQQQQRAKEAGKRSLED